MRLLKTWLAALALTLPFAAPAGAATAPAPAATQPAFDVAMTRDTADAAVRRPVVALKSRSALIVRADNGEVLLRKNIDREVPIASITKLMTAMVVLDAQQSLDEVIPVTKDDVDALRHTTSRLTVGAKLTRRELLLLALMSSENRAAAALIRNYPGGREAGIAAMNRKAAEIGMTQAHFVDGTGLNDENRASPIDLVRLVKAAESYPDIRRSTTTAQYVAKIGRRPQLFHNTNPLVKSQDWDIALTKTGYINEAGRCLVMKARIAETPVIMVLLDSSGLRTRIGDANRVRKWLETTLRRPDRVASLD